MEILYTEPYKRTKSSFTQHPSSLTQQREKVEAQLEGLTSRMIDAIRYNIENVGDWLHVTADSGSAPPSFSFGINAADADIGFAGKVVGIGAADSGNGQLVLSSDDFFQLNVANTIDIQTDGTVMVTSVGDFEVSGSADGYIHALTNLTLQSFGGLSLFASGNIFVASTSTATGTSVMSFCINDTNQFLIRDVDTTMDYFRVGSAIARFRLQPGISFEIADSSNVVIFRVDDDGTLHIPTGKTLVADL